MATYSFTFLPFGRVVRGMYCPAFLVQATTPASSDQHQCLNADARLPLHFSLTTWCFLPVLDSTYTERKSDFVRHKIECLELKYNIDDSLGPSQLVIMNGLPQALTMTVIITMPSSNYDFIHPIPYNFSIIATKPLLFFNVLFHIPLPTRKPILSLF